MILNRPYTMVFAAWLSLLLTGFSASSVAESQFLEHADQLVPTKANPLMSFYLPQASNQKLATYTKIMVDAPLVFIDPDSPYKGINLAKLNAVTEAFRAKVIEAMSGDFEVVEQPGADVLYLRLAMVDLSLKKKRFHILGYTPIGLVFRAGKEAFESEMNRAVQHLSLLGLKIEGQLIDSNSGELLGEFVNDRPTNKKDPESWNALKKSMADYATMLDCMIVNSRSGPETEAKCMKQYQQAETAYEAGSATQAYVAMRHPAD